MGILKYSIWVFENAFSKNPVDGTNTPIFQVLAIISNHEKEGIALETEGGGGEMFSDPEEKMVLIWKKAFSFCEKK